MNFIKTFKYDTRKKGYSYKTVDILETVDYSTINTYERTADELIINTQEVNEGFVSEYGGRNERDRLQDTKSYLNRDKVLFFHKLEENTRIYDSYIEDYISTDGFILAQVGSHEYLVDLKNTATIKNGDFIIQDRHYKPLKIEDKKIETKNIDFYDTSCFENIAGSYNVVGITPFYVPKMVEMARYSELLQNPNIKAFLTEVNEKQTNNIEDIINNLKELVYKEYHLSGHNTTYDYREICYDRDRHEREESVKENTLKLVIEQLCMDEENNKIVA